MPPRTRFDFNLFRALEVFSAVAETRHLTRAAEMLGMTQSAVSQQLRNLEVALGSKVFDRTARPLGLTAAGMIVRKRSQRILNELDDLQFEIGRLDTAPIPMLRLGVLPSIATTLTSALVRTARDGFAIPEVSIYAGLATDHGAQLRNRQFDIAITSDPLYELDGLERCPILQENFLLVLPTAYRGDPRDFAAVTRDLSFIRFHPAAPVGRLIDRHMRRVRIELPRTIEADRASMVIASVAAGEGFSILSPTLLIDGLMESHPIAIHPLPIQNFSRSITVVARRGELGKIPQAIAAEAIKVLKRSLKRLGGARLDQAVTFAAE